MQTSRRLTKYFSLFQNINAGASAVQKAEFEDRCKLLWRKSQAEERQHIKEANKRAEKNMENMVKDLMEMFPAIEEQLVRDTLLQHDLDSQAAAQVLIVLSGSCDPSTQPPASSSTKPSKPDQPVIQHDDLNEFPAMAPPRVDSEGWEKLPDHVMKQQDNAQNWGEKAKGVPEDWAEVNSQVRQSSPRGINGYSSPRAASPRSSTGNAPQTDAIDIDDFDCELEHDLRKGIGHKAHHNTKVRDKAAPTIRSKPPGFKKETE